MNRLTQNIIKSTNFLRNQQKLHQFSHSQKYSANCYINTLQNPSISYKFAEYRGNKQNKKQWKQSSLAEKQKQKQLSQKLKEQQEKFPSGEDQDKLQQTINKLDNSEKISIVQNRHEDPPSFLNAGMFFSLVPVGYFYSKTGFSPFFSAEYTNSLCMMLDWSGLLMASFTGGYFFYHMFRSYRQNDYFERKPYFKTIIGVNMLSASVSMCLIQSLNIFAVMPIFVGALVSMPFIYQTGDIGSVHKMYISMYLRYTLLLGATLLMVGMGQMSFNNYKTKMDDSLKELSQRSLREYEDLQEQENLKQKQEELEKEEEQKNKKKNKWF